MRRLILALVFGAGLVLGAAAGCWWSARVFSRLTLSKEVEMASMSAFEAEWLARLRLNETESVIKDIANYMDIQASALAQWNDATPPDDKTRKARDRWLVPVKVYHQSYPVTGDEAARINSFLATIPGRSPDSVCKSGICRLDDRRIALMNSNTNSPAK